MLTIGVKVPKLLVVAAWEPELVRFRQRLGAGGLRGIEVVLAAVGVGVVEAAIEMTRCVGLHAPDGALLLGTCGAFELAPASASASARALAPGAVVTGARVALVDGSCVAGTAALPGPMPCEARFDDALADALVAAGARNVQIANTAGITTDDALAASLSRAGGHDVEHLEAFGFARACAVAALPCAVALGVANMVGARGRADWLANHVDASARAADVAFDALPAVAAALVARTSTTARSPARA